MLLLLSYLHPLEKFFDGIALIHPLDIDQRGMHGFLGFLNWNGLVAFFLIDNTLREDGHKVA